MAQSGKTAETYFAAAQRLPREFLRERFIENGLTDAEVRALQADARDTKTQELLGQASESVDGRIERGLAQANRRQGQRQERAKARARSDDTVLLALLTDIDRMESRLADQYGNGFAGDLLADLSAKGLIGDGEYARIMAIGDDTERRRAIALRIQEGLDNGTIKPDDVTDHPWAHAWLDKHKEATTEIARQVASYERGEVDLDELNGNAVHEAGNSAFSDDRASVSAAEAETIAVEQSAETQSDTVKMASNLDLSGLKL